MPTISLTVRQKTGSKGSLETWGEALANPRQAIETVRTLLAQNLAERFATQTDPWGKPWPPPSPVTVAMRGGEVSSGLEQKRFSRLDKGGKLAVVGVRSPAARRRHFGAPNNRMFGRYAAPVPARPVLPIKRGRVDLPRELLRAIMDAVREQLRRVARGDA